MWTSARSFLTTPEFDAWMASLPAKQANRVARVVELLERRGPALDRPSADTIKGARAHNMKELRPRRGLVDPLTGEEESDDLARLARSVAALGGQLEVDAVFPEETVQLLLLEKVPHDSR